MIDLRNHKNWDNLNGTLAVSMLPQIGNQDSQRHVLLNGSTGNFCLDYSEEDYNNVIAKQRAWSTNTGFYVKITSNNKVIVTGWWDDHREELPYEKILEKPQKFYEAICKFTPKNTDGIISFAKEAFIKLRNCIQEPDNGQISLRAFMYLLAALEDKVDTASEVDSKKWHLPAYDSSLIAAHDWEWLYKAFQNGCNNIQPEIKLVLRHASNRLFQEAHREATRKDFQMSLWGGTDRSYNSGISEGAFYTPTPLVRTIVQDSLWALDKVKPLSERTTLRILDPACGSAEFLREALRQLKIRNYVGDIIITGWDISEIACEMSNFVLNYENNTEWKGKVKMKIEKKDSLEYNWGNEIKYDIVLMNPPFIPFAKLGERKSIIKEQLNGLINRQPDMAAVFWKKAAEVTADNGVLGLILPYSLIGAETYNKLRLHIKEELKMDFSLIARLGSAGLFEKAMIIPAVLVGTKTLSSNSNTVLWTNNQQTSAYTAFRKLRIYRNKDIPTPITENNYSIYDDEFLTKEKIWSVKSYQIYQLSNKLKGFNTVGKLFKVTRGADAGNNAAFILSKKDWLELPKKERAYFRCSVMRESIENGKLNDKWFMFYPYGAFILKSESELMQKLPVYYEKYLKQNIVKLKKRRGREEKWWTLNEHRPWQVKSTSKLVSSYFGKSRYFAFDQMGKYLVGQSFAWLPKKAELDKEQYYFAYLALLHAPLIDTLLEMVSVNIAGGQFDLSKHYIDKMPLPDLTKADQSILSDLVEIGKSIHNGKEIIQKDLDQRVANTYGLNLENFK